MFTESNKTQVGQLLLDIVSIGLAFGFEYLDLVDGSVSIEYELYGDLAVFGQSEVFVKAL